MDRKFMKNLSPELSAPAPGLYTCYDHNIQTSSLKSLGQSKLNFMWSILRKGGTKNYINGPGHMTKMATMAINSILFSRTRRPMILKLCLKHQ